jgi:hypothetical protein
VDHVRDPAELAAEGEGRAAEEGEALGVVREVGLGLGAVDALPPEEALVVQEVGLDRGPGLASSFERSML